MSYYNNIDEAAKKKNIKDCFKSIKEKTDDFVKIADIQRESVSYDEHKSALCSLLLFSSKAVPSFMHKLDDGYKKKECFVCYALIIEIDSYVVILSRHANGMNEFKNNLKSIDGSKLTGALLDADSLFTQLRLGSMSLNNNVLRNRSFEGNDLNQSMPLFGLGQSVVKTARIRQPNEDTTTITLSTSRVAKFGSAKKNISELCFWADMVISGIKNPMDLKHTMLSNFSRPVKWKNEYMRIMPIYLLVDTHELMHKIDEQHVELVYVNGNDEVKNRRISHFGC